MSIYAYHTVICLYRTLVSTVSRRGVPSDGMLLVEGSRVLSTPLFLHTRVRVLLRDLFLPLGVPSVIEISNHTPPRATFGPSLLCPFLGLKGDPTFRFLFAALADAQEREGAGVEPCNVFCIYSNRVVRFPRVRPSTFK